MNKKVGVVAAIFLGVMVLCCLGSLFMARQAFNKVRETVTKDQEFVAKALEDTAKTWDEKAFATYADESFKTPDKQEQTKKLFVTLKEKLGPLVKLGEVKVLNRSAFRSSTNGDAQGFFVSFRAAAKFQKRDGVFDVTVRNYKDQKTIFAISLNPDEVTADSVEANNASNKPN